MKKQNDIIFFLGAIGITYLLLRIAKKGKMKPFIIKGSYIVPKGTKYPEDALHSFERRKFDGFGGRMATKIREKMAEVYKRGINPDISDIKIKVDSKNYAVEWQATIKQSEDGKAYLGISTVGSAGSDADYRAKQQIEKMKTFVKGSKDYKLVKDFINPKGIYIRQFFYKYTLPDEFPPH